MCRTSPNIRILNSYWLAYVILFSNAIELFKINFWWNCFENDYLRGLIFLSFTEEWSCCVYFNGMRYWGVRQISVFKIYTYLIIIHLWKISFLTIFSKKFFQKIILKKGGPFVFEMRCSQPRIRLVWSRDMRDYNTDLKCRSGLVSTY